MAARLASAGIGIPLLVAAVWYGPPALTLLAALVAALGAWEFSRLAGDAGARPFHLLSIALGVALAVNGHFQGAYTLPILGTGLLAALVWLLLRGVREGALADWSVTIGGALYTGLPLSFGLLMRSLEQGREWLLFTLLATFATDAGAFLVGRLVGRHALAPLISPRKTWEGAAGGLGAGVGASMALALLLSLPLALWYAALFGAAIGLAAQVGDLAQSLLKRAAGAKEAGWLIPGHGGVLDRFDSVAFTLVVMYYLAWWVASG